MALAPIDIQKMRFNQRMRGFDTTEVEGFLVLVAEELAGRLAQIEKLDRENKYYRQRLEETMQREHQLQQTLLRAQRRELQLKFKNTLDLFQRILEAEMDDEHNTATVHTLPRRKKEAAKEA